MQRDISLQTKSGTFSFQPKTGSYSLKDGNFTLQDLTPALYLDGKKVAFKAWKTTDPIRNAFSAEATAKDATLHLKVKVDSDGKFTLALSLTLKNPCEHIKVRYFDETSIAADHLAVQRISMGGGELIPLREKGMKPTEFTGQTMLLITRKGQQLAISSPLMGDHVEKYCGTARYGKVEKFYAGYDIEHITSKKITLKPLSFRVGDGFQALYAYGEENCKLHRNFDEIVAPGWNSWDYYRWTITEDEVLENANFIAKDPVLSKHVKKIIIDDGWQYAYGEWDANSKFPHGMPWMAKQIKKLGFKPGLWICPTIAEPHSWIAQMEPDMMGKAENGQPTLCFDCMRRNAFVLDPTVPRVRQWIYDLFDRYAGYGYEYFKLDFLGATCAARQFTDKTIGRGHIMDYTIGVAREAVKGRAQILGCNYMFCGGEKPVDCVRVGGDIHARWGSICGNTPSVAMRFWANKKLWVNDPDFALCRGFDTSDDPMLTQMLCCLVFVKPEETDPNFEPGNWRLVDMKRAQAEVLLSIVICAGGAVNLSDKVTRLNESGLDLARRVVSAESGDAAIPLDLFSKALPEYWLQRVGGYHRILMVNWSDKPAVRSVNLNQLGVCGRKAVNFWNDKAVKISKGVIEAEVPARSCLFVVVK